MKMLTGNIGSGFGVAGRNLSPVEILICKRIGFKSVVHGTLNVRLNEPYFIKPNALIERAGRGILDTRISDELL